MVETAGFGDVASPFGGRPWRDVLRFEVFVDHGRVRASEGALAATPAQTFNGAGAGLVFRLPHLHGLELELSAAKPVGGTAFDDDDVRAWARVGLTF